MNRYRIGLLIVLMVVGWPVVSAAAQGGVYPDYEDVYINDYAGVIDASDEAEIRTMLEWLYADYGFEVAVLTVDSYREYSAHNETIEVFAKGVFNTWGVGDAERNDGVLLVVAIEEREVRIEVGVGYGDSLDADMQAVIDEQIIPAFRRDDYSGGIVAGAQGIVLVLTGDSPAVLVATEAPPSMNSSGDSTAAPAVTATATRARMATATRVSAAPPVATTASDADGDDSGVNPYMVGGAGAGLLGVGGVVARRYWRYRQRKCSACGAMMQRLDEVADDVHLSSGEKAEELLASIDYDVWLCPRCGRHDIRGYTNFLARYRHCPSCHSRTLRVESRTTVSPTTTHDGEKVIEQFCYHCKYGDKQTIILPMIEVSSGGGYDDDDDDFHFGSGGGHSHRSSSRSSSSRSSSRRSSSRRSSFGGGKSKGGGASGSW